MDKTYYPFSQPLYIMLKPAGSQCNMECSYCYYLEKENFYSSDRKHVMSDSLLEKFIKEYIEAQTTGYVLFTWHGGETLLRNINFYQKAIELQRKYAGGRQIDNCIQTNGTLLNEEWCKFFKRNNWLVGVSVDGPEEFHDEYRRFAGGKRSHEKVLRGIRLLDDYGVEWNAMAVVNDFNVNYPSEFYNFFKSLNCRYIQFTPIVERIVGNVDLAGMAKIQTKNNRLAALGTIEPSCIAPFSVNPDKWGTFLCKIFDEWVKNDVGEYFVQLFDTTLALWMDAQPSLCSFAKNCGHAGVMEFNGDIYSCDHFVFPEYKLGNIYQKSLIEMMYGKEQSAFGTAKSESLPGMCKRCKWLFACNGECPKNRIMTTPEGEPGLNYLCRGYKKYYAHVAPFMDFMKIELLNGRPPANIMHAIRKGIFNSCF